ncbi:hypothetical protein PENDEC_c002G05756 [Penicillium decumbens]|uniref:Uncharacterized protein n=1 Tax=Penicillium decumbens TaxID=69771 RepID=A0A1V6PL66_PENDC|nr:hypothetical protein PENDEC_c002G05756 [Penicillium decumbens]
MTDTSNRRRGVTLDLTLNNDRILRTLTELFKRCKRKTSRDPSMPNPAHCVSRVTDILDMTVRDAHVDDITAYAIMVAYPRGDWIHNYDDFESRKDAPTCRDSVFTVRTPRLLHLTSERKPTPKTTRLDAGRWDTPVAQPWSTYVTAGQPAVPQIVQIAPAPQVEPRELATQPETPVPIGARGPQTQLLTPITQERAPSLRTAEMPDIYATVANRMNVPMEDRTGPGLVSPTCQHQMPWHY